MTDKQSVSQSRDVHWRLFSPSRVVTRYVSRRSICPAAGSSCVVINHKKLRRAHITPTSRNNLVTHSHIHTETGWADDQPYGVCFSSLERTTTTMRTPLTFRSFFCIVYVQPPSTSVVQVQHSVGCVCVTLSVVQGE